MNHVLSMLVNLSLVIRYGPERSEGPSLMVLVKGLPTYTWLIGSELSPHFFLSFAWLSLNNCGTIGLVWNISDLHVPIKISHQVYAITTFTYCNVFIALEFDLVIQSYLWVYSELCSIIEWSFHFKRVIFSCLSTSCLSCFGCFSHEKNSQIVEPLSWHTM